MQNWFCLKHLKDNNKPNNLISFIINKKCLNECVKREDSWDKSAYIEGAMFFLNGGGWFCCIIKLVVWVYNNSMYIPQGFNHLYGIPLIMEVGSLNTKIGFAGKERPDLIVPSVSWSLFRQSRSTRPPEKK
jgi:hypothetical protein